MDRLNVSRSFSTLLGCNAGYVDTAGFLALKGLFTAHVTGNFVTLASAAVQGSSGALAKLTALPVFCVVLILVRLASNSFRYGDEINMKILLGVKITLLSLAAYILVGFGPFGDADGRYAFTAGILLVSAMAIQNGIHRIYFPSAPPSTLMTGTTTQVVVDLVDVARGNLGNDKAVVIARLKKMLPALLAFAAGCATAAVLFINFSMWCFLVPVIVAALSVTSVTTPKTVSQT